MLRVEAVGGDITAAVDSCEHKPVSESDSGDAVEPGEKADEAAKCDDEVSRSEDDGNE